ncbi:MAG: hypothetical protein Q4E82_01945 [Peptococcaceae bacterium]|nr:hypothetical protein [Peptococcaceae bacterium]
MLETTYLEYLEKTISSYTEKEKKYLVRELVNLGVASENEKYCKQQTLDGNIIIDISKGSLADKVISCIQGSKIAIKFIEKWEFIRDYKYSSYFFSDSFEDILEKANDISLQNDCCENNYISTESIGNPIRYEDEERVFLKFNLAFSAVHPLSGEELLVKYPIVIVFHKGYQLLEIRFDVLKRVFLSDKKSQTIYVDILNQVIDYFKESFECELKPLNLDYLVNVCKNDNSVKLIAQYMKLANGGNAQLEVGNNQEYVLPFLGELRELINANQMALDNIPNFKEALEQFMYEMEEMSDYPWIELLWEHEIKTRSIRVKVIFNYRDSSYCLVQHYSSNVLIGMERMNYVVKYIVDNRIDDRPTI